MTYDSYINNMMIRYWQLNGALPMTTHNVPERVRHSILCEIQSIRFALTAHCENLDDLDAKDLNKTDD